MYPLLSEVRMFYEKFRLSFHLAVKHGSTKFLYCVIFVSRLNEMFFPFQLVWGASNELGMAKAKTKDNLNVYVVARYKPAGNVVNLFESNVKPKQ